jgi:virginiamycin B lyase
VSYPANNYAAYPYAIAAGPVGSIWFGRYLSGTYVTSPSDGEVGYLDAASGAITAFDTGSRTAPSDLVQGPDGNMWFTSIGAAKGIGHIGPHGTGGALTAIGGYAPRSLTFGTDGFIYATDAANNVIIKVSRDQLQTTNVDPGEGSVLLGGAAGGGAGLGKVKLGKKPVAVRNNAVNLRLACPKEVAAGCVGKARLTTNAKKKPTAVSRSVGYKVKAGKKGQLKLKLTAKGLKALKKGKVTKLRLELYVKGAKEPAVVQVVKVRR